MELPAFFLVSGVAVKVVETDDGGLDVLRYVPETREFRRAMEYLELVTFPGGHSDVEIVSEPRFAAYLAELEATTAG